MVLQYIWLKVNKQTLEEQAVEPQPVLLQVLPLVEQQVVLLELQVQELLQVQTHSQVWPVWAVWEEWEDSQEAWEEWACHQAAWAAWEEWEAWVECHQT